MLGESGMPKPYSQDLRERVVGAVAAGKSRHAAAAQFKVSASSAIRWVQRWQASGAVAAKPTGGSTSPLEKHESELLAVASEQPDLTLDEFCAVLGERKIATSRVSVCRFFSRHKLSFKKKFCTPANKSAPRWPKRASAGGRTSQALIRLA